MNKALITTLFIVAIAAAAVFLGSSELKNLAQIGRQVSVTETPRLLPVSPSRTPYERSQLQASAYTHFINLFGSEAEGTLNLIEPVDGFKQAITKKPFGIFITPKTSPVENDKFTGYHTGVDSEFTTSQEEVPVRAIADGTIVVKKWATGYGGVIVIKHSINGVSVFALYGHLDQASFTAKNQVKAGEQIAVLGDDHSQETDGARKHLHFSIYTGEKVDIRGYVQNESELSGWLNPLDLY